MYGIDRKTPPAGAGESKKHIQAISDALSHRNPGFLPRGELFITQPFLDRFFADLRGSYPRQLNAAVRAMGLSLVGLDLNEGASMLLPSLGEAGELEDRFIAGYINGPVSRLIESHGFVDAMKSMRKEPALFSETTGNLLRFIENGAKAARKHGLMAIALADDIAGNKGLLFSPDYFKNTVWPAYREIGEIIKGNGLSAFFHSDGDIRKIIELLLQAGYDCIHPVDGQGGLDLYALQKEFGERVSFMGHIDVMAWDADRIASEIDRAEKVFDKGGLILGSMGGISMDVKPEALRALYPGLEE
jgi:uroporphyrinogen decarboxylase